MEVIYDIIDRWEGKRVGRLVCKDGRFTVYDRVNGAEPYAFLTQEDAEHYIETRMTTWYELAHYVPFELVGALLKKHGL